MKHIQQRNDYDCGFAVAAMLSNVSIRETRKVARCIAKEGGASRGLHLTEMQWLLEGLTGREWRITRVADRPLVTYRPRCTKGAIFLQGSYDWGHCIAFRQPQRPLSGWIYDPEYSECVDARFYSRRQWRVRRLIWCPSDYPHLVT
jgi:hypothetical protein